ncbi:hypothetical protein SLEP1_g41421 [Rubroshorea leprosula]|uniref:Uncharacterized protein n=1 Tax=Rubroshorea leprosula TaxID=152421 RepID=A0AAV5L6K8_9ROSI|nr:hypothetical protein SLEP1_g41421 [Rubroshorea leprosula]
MIFSPSSVTMELEWYVKAGFSGDDAPRAVFPSIMGRPRMLKRNMFKQIYP